MRRSLSTRARWMRRRDPGALPPRFPPRGWSRRRARRCRRSATPGARARESRVARVGARHPASGSWSTRAAATAGTASPFPASGPRNTQASRSFGARGSQTDSEWHAHASSSDSFMCGGIAGPIEAASAASRKSAKSSREVGAGAVPNRRCRARVGGTSSASAPGRAASTAGRFRFRLRVRRPRLFELELGRIERRELVPFVRPLRCSFSEGRPPRPIERREDANLLALRSASACPFPQRTAPPGCRRTASRALPRRAARSRDAQDDIDLRPGVDSGVRRGRAVTASANAEAPDESAAAIDDSAEAFSTRSSRFAPFVSVPPATLGTFLRLDGVACRSRPRARLRGRRPLWVFYLDGAAADETPGFVLTATSSTVPFVASRPVDLLFPKASSVSSPAGKPSAVPSPPRRARARAASPAAHPSARAAEKLEPLGVPVLVPHAVLIVNRRTPPLCFETCPGAKTP